MYTYVLTSSQYWYAPPKNNLVFFFDYYFVLFIFFPKGPALINHKQSGCRCRVSLSALLCRHICRSSYETRKAPKGPKVPKIDHWITAVELPLDPVRGMVITQQKRLVLWPFLVLIVLHCCNISLQLIWVYLEFQVLLSHNGRIIIVIECSPEEKRLTP